MMIEKTFSLGRIISKIALFSLIILASNCQTIKDTDPGKTKEAELLNTQKSLMVSFLNRGLPNMAYRELKKLIKKHPNDPDFKNLMGLTQLAMRNPRKAAQYFRESFKLQPRISVALNLSSAFIESGNYKKAINLLKRTMKQPGFGTYKHPERVSHNIGLAYERIKSYKQAKIFYRRALMENPQYYMSLMRLGQLYEKTKKLKYAGAQFEKAKVSCPRCFDPINALTMVYIAQGKPRKAMGEIVDYMKREGVSKVDKKKARSLLTMTRKISKSRRAVLSQKRPSQ